MVDLPNHHPMGFRKIQEYASWVHVQHKNAKQNSLLYDATAKRYTALSSPERRWGKATSRLLAQASIHINVILKNLLTLVSFSLSNSNAINHFVLSKNLGNWDRLFKMFLDPLDFLCRSSTVQLDFHNVCLFLTQLKKLHLHINK